MLTAATGTRRRRERDGCVVESAPLAALLRAFAARWDREATAGRFGHGDVRNGMSMVTALAWLSSESGLPEATILNVAQRRYRTTELRVADAILTALGRPEAFHDGTLEVMPNPNAARQARAACCGGSTAAA